jgi:hypothetical protein
LRTRRRDVLFPSFERVIGILPEGCFDCRHARNLRLARQLDATPHGALASVELRHPGLV